MTFLGEKTEKNITILVPIRKEITRIDTNGEKIIKTIFYRLQFIDRAKFMTSSLSSLFNNLAEGILKVECKYRPNGKNFETCGIKYKYCNRFLECTNLIGDLLEHKCLCCNKNYRKFDENLKRQFFNKYKFSNNDIVAKKCLLT